MNEQYLENNYKCWLCNSTKLKLVKPSNIMQPLANYNFKISNSDYGVTASIYQCLECNFMFCPELNSVLKYYENMSDPEYETGRKQRGLQEKKTLEYVSMFKDRGRLLDVGAGSGMLVEQALRMGFDAEGVEPSKWLHARAQELRLPVHLGTFPHPEINGNYDVITAVDVLEHVSNPLTLLSEIRRALNVDGIAVIVTPDVKSLAARVFKWKWWHFRVAHISYFSKETLLFALQKTGYRVRDMRRASWFFSADYLIDRMRQYIPNLFPIPKCHFLKNITIPLNLLDSYVVVASRNNE